MASLCLSPAVTGSKHSPFHHLKFYLKEFYLKEFYVVAILGEVLDGLILKAAPPPPPPSVSCHKDASEAERLTSSVGPFVSRLFSTVGPERVIRLFSMGFFFYCKLISKPSFEVK